MREENLTGFLFCFFSCSFIALLLTLHCSFPRRSIPMPYSTGLFNDAVAGLRRGRHIFDDLGISLCRLANNPSSTLQIFPRPPCNIPSSNHHCPIVRPGRLSLFHTILPTIVRTISRHFAHDERFHAVDARFCAVDATNRLPVETNRCRILQRCR
ncbi:hypothetical protein C8J56DRAFT_396601 [Mycena floridula]|nr:hypothetical protein C8J56DRAFT_396601 [Mycena floridula]